MIATVGPLLADGPSVRADAVDYELVWFGIDPSRAALGSFSDVFLAASPIWRLVAGYLAADETEAVLRVTSHGHPVARLTPAADSCGVDPEGEITTEEHILMAPTAGLAFVADAGTRWVPTAAGAARARGDGHAWGFTIVHGPAEDKIRARIDLLASLTRVGGRRG